MTKCTSVRPKLVKSVHFNPSNQTFTTREYRDSTAMELGLDSGGRYEFFCLQLDLDCIKTIFRK